MSARKDETPIFKPDSNATLVSEIKPAAPDPRNARVSKVHAEIARQVKDGSIYKQPRKPR
jgi:hypothetical protein